LNDGFNPSVIANPALAISPLADSARFIVLEMVEVYWAVTT